MATGNAKDLVALKSSLERLPALLARLAECGSTAACRPAPAGSIRLTTWSS